MPFLMQNVVCTAYLGCQLDLEKIHKYTKNSEYDPKTFPALRMKIREPRTSALIYKSGMIVCVGARNELSATLATRKYGRIIKIIGFPARFLDFKIQNMTGSFDFNFPIRLEDLAREHSSRSTYNPESFPGVIYRMEKPQVVIKIFVSGKVDLTGAKTKEEMNEAFEKISAILTDYKI